LLESVVANPDQAISVVPLLTHAERHQLLVEWNPTPPEHSQGALWHERFEAQAVRTPDAVAIMSEGDTLTYRELNTRVNQLAHHLRSLGVGPEVVVGLCLVRSPELVVGLLGILKAGGACVPLEPTYPQDRLAFMINDTQLAVIVTQARLRHQLPPHRARVVCLDTDWGDIAQASTEPLISGVTDGNLAFVFYTSGSTGQPKAVMWAHGREPMDQNETEATERLTAADRHVLKSTLGFTLFAREIFWPLLTGAPMVVVPPGREQDSSYLVRFIAEQCISVVSMVPSMLRMLLVEPEFDRCQSLKQVICFGEALPAELQDRLFARLNTDLSVYYGVTEAPSATSWTREHGDTRRIVNIGRRLPNKQVFVLDARLQAVPIAVLGEIHIGGNLARGYLNRPDLTAEKFIPNPSLIEREPVCIRQVILVGTCRTGPLSSWVGATIRSTFGACASSWGRSRRRSASIREYSRPW
jgi:amino acid adenylation domain-containing protein